MSTRWTVATAPPFSPNTPQAIGAFRQTEYTAKAQEHPYPAQGANASPASPLSLPR